MKENKQKNMNWIPLGKSKMRIKDAKTAAMFDISIRQVGDVLWIGLC